MVQQPDFLIAGAPRCGSTTLFRALDGHPDVFMARPKEVRYFDRHLDRGIDWYLSHFADVAPGQLAGEATPSYMADKAAMDEIASVLGGVRLIFILRDPVDRAYSHYWMLRTRGFESGSFEEYLQTSDAIEVGRYVDHLRSIEEQFSRSGMLVVFHEDLRTDPQGMYQQVCRFLGVDDGFEPDVLGEKVNAHVEFRSIAVREWTKKLPRSMSGAKRILGRANTKRGTAYPPMDPETRTYLTNEYRGSTAELSSWLGREVPGWAARP